MGISAGPQIIRDSSLVLGLDASDTNSNYRSTGRIWNDLSGNNNTGSIVNGAALNNDGYGSFTFNGINNYITLTRPVQDDFTLSCWFKTLQSFGTSDSWYNGAGLIDGEVAGTANDFGLTIGSGKILFGTGNSDTTITSSLTYNDNNWHQATSTRVKSTGVIVLYVDGIQVATATGGTNSLTAPTSLRIGSIQTNINFFSGSIANVQIYNKALSATEIQTNYNQYLPRFISPTTPDIITYTSLNQATAITVFNDDIEFSNILIGTSSPLANAVATSNSPSI
jgi:hypothetical protein